MTSVENAKRKLVWVDVEEEGHQPSNYEVSWQSDGKNADLKEISAVIQRKRPSTTKYFERGLYVFQIESLAKKGRWITLGENSPVKNESDLKCIFTSGKAAEKPSQCQPLLKEIGEF